MDLKDVDFSVFDEFLKKRPEVSIDNLKIDLEKYYLPFAGKLVELKKQHNSNDGLVIGISAIQGAGKTTQGEIMAILLSSQGMSSVSLSIDDHYITHKELCALRDKDPRFVRRGVTHDKPLAILNLRDLKKMEEDIPVLVSGYDKGANMGDGERFRFVNLTEGLVLKTKVTEKELFIDKKTETLKVLELISAGYNNSEVFLQNNMGSDLPLVDHLLPKELIDFLVPLLNEEITVSLSDPETAVFKSNASEIKIPKKSLPSSWKLITKKPDFIFYDGWMLGARSVEDESVFESGLPALEKREDIEFAKFVNKKLLDYEPLWQMLNFLNVLYVINYQDSLKWRDQAEEALRQKGEGMGKEQIVEFVHYFWRSVHPAIHIKNLSQDELHTNQVVIINDDHSIKEVLSPMDVKKNIHNPSNQ